MEDFDKNVLMGLYLRGSSTEEFIADFINSDKCTEEMVNYTSQDGDCILTFAAKDSKDKIVKALINKCAKVNYVQPENNMNALMLCIYYATEFDPVSIGKQEATAQLLLEAGTNVNFVTVWSAFTLACECKRNHLLQKLLPYEVDMDYKDMDGKTGMDYLKEKNNQVGLSIVNSYLLNKQLQQELKSSEGQKKKPKI